MGDRNDLERVRRANPLAEVAREYGVELRARGRDLWACCPFHGEATASFHVREEEGFFKCFGCGEAGDVFKFVQLADRCEFARALEILTRRAGISPAARAEDARKRPPLQPARQARAAIKDNDGARGDRSPREPVTVAQLAAAKQLDPEFLTSLGLHESRGMVVIPYRLADGSAAPRTRLRRGLGGGDSIWNHRPDDLPGTDSGIVPYGLDRLFLIEYCEGRLWIVEGESDCWALWGQGIAALGIPGASMTNCLEKPHLGAATTLTISREPGDAGETFVEALRKRLGAVGYEGRIEVVRFGTDLDDSPQMDTDNHGSI